MTVQDASPSYKTKLDELLQRYRGKTSDSPSLTPAAPTLSNNEGSWPPVREPWKHQPSSGHRSVTRSVRSSASSTESPFREAARQRLASGPLTAGLTSTTPVTQETSLITPEIEQYYEYHRELYDFTFGKTKNTARKVLESGWQNTNVPAEYSIPRYDSRLDPHCPNGWSQKSTRPRTAPTRSSKAKLRKGTSSRPRTLERAPDRSSSKRAVYINNNLLKHPSIADFAPMPLEMPTQLIRHKPSKRRLQKRGPRGAQNGFEELEGDMVHMSSFQGVQADIEQLWDQLKLPQGECEHYTHSFLDVPSVANMREATEHLRTLHLHRSATLEVLRSIQAREAVLAELHTVLASQSGQEMSALMVLVPQLRERTVDVVEGVHRWRDGLWQPLPFSFKGQNYLEQILVDVQPLSALEYTCTLPVQHHDSEAADGHVFVFLSAERPEQLLARDQLQRLQALEAAVLAEPQQQQQLHVQTTHLLQRGFLAPTLKPAELAEPSPVDDWEQQRSRSSRPASHDQPAPARLSTPPELEAYGTPPRDAQRPTAVRTSATEASLLSRHEASSPYGSPVHTPGSVPTLDLNLVRKDGKAGKRPKVKTQSSSRMEALNLNTILEDRAELFGGCTTLDPPVKDTKDLQSSDVCHDTDDEVAAIMGGAGRRSPVPGLDLSECGATDSS